MASYTKWQDWTTVAAGAATNITQSRKKWLDLVAVDAVTVRLELRQITGGTLYFQTAASAEGPWLNAASHTAVSEQTTQFLTYYAAPSKLRRWLRWQYVTTGAQSATFRITYAEVDLQLGSEASAM